MTVNVKPMPESYRKISKKFRPQPPPVNAISPEEIELARELFKILDEESKDWYGRTGIFKDID